jgi:hypothetical protein
VGTLQEKWDLKTRLANLGIYQGNSESLELRSNREIPMHCIATSPIDGEKGDDI